MRIITILGTRPEIIKLSPLIPKLDKTFKNILIHTGQHYDWLMDKLFFEELNVRVPDYYLQIKNKDYLSKIITMIEQMNEIIKKEKPNYVLVFGDTNSTLAGAISSKINQIPIIHIEAGSRSGNPDQPEEQNRVVIDRLSDYLLTINEKDKLNLKTENIRNNIHVVGNLLYESVSNNIKLAEKVNILDNYNLKPNEYILVTLHRSETIDHREKFSIIINILNDIAEQINILFPLHPHTKNSLTEFGLTLSKNIITTEPLGYIKFLNLLKNCKLVLTDSGGVLEESVIIKKPVAILNDYTEFPQFVENGYALLAGVNGNTSYKIRNLLNNEHLLIQMSSIERKEISNVSDNIIDFLKKAIK